MPTLGLGNVSRVPRLQQLEHVARHDVPHNRHDAAATHREERQRQAVVAREDRQVGESQSLRSLVH